MGGHTGGLGESALLIGAVSQSLGLLALLRPAVTSILGVFSALIGLGGGDRGRSRPPPSLRHSAALWAFARHSALCAWCHLSSSNHRTAHAAFRPFSCLYARYRLWPKKLVSDGPRHEPWTRKSTDPARILANPPCGAAADRPCSSSCPKGPAMRSRPRRPVRCVVTMCNLCSVQFHALGGGA